MATIITNDARVENARNFIDSISDCEDNARTYMFIGKPTPWEDDNDPPYPDNSVKEFFDVHQQMLSLKRIFTNDAFLLLPRIEWISGTVFDMYRHDYSNKNLAHSKANNLFKAVFYCINSNNVVYVCLDNNNDNPSSVMPENETYDPFYTSDGYQWMKLYTIGSQAMIDYSTFNYIPITSDGANIDNFVRTDGEILTVKIDSPGDRYTTSPGGVPNEITNYYCHIRGDGKGAVANVRVSLGQIVEIRMSRRGEGYTFGELDFSPNNVYRSLKDLDFETNGLNPRGDGTFKSTVIISPPNGWGSDIARQLGGFRVGVFSNMNYQLLDFFPETTFRQVGLIQDPEQIPVLPENQSTLSGVHAFTVRDISGPGKFIIGEFIEQSNLEVETGITKTSIGIVVGWDQAEKILRYIQVPESCRDQDGNMYPFTAATHIIAKESGKIVEVRPFDGSLSGLVFNNGYAEREIVPYTGKLIYLSNNTPITRQPTQTERISLTISF